MKTLLIVLLALLVGAAAQANLGNARQITQIMKPALINVTCEEKSVVLDKFLDGDFNFLIRKYKIPQPNFGGQEPLVRLFMRRIKQKTANFTCEEKSKLLDNALDLNMGKLRRVLEGKGKNNRGIVGKVLQNPGKYMNNRGIVQNAGKFLQNPGKGKIVENWGNLEQLAKVLKEAVKDKDCATKSKVLKSLMKREFTSLKTQYGIPEPNFGNMQGMIRHVSDLLEDKYSLIPCEMKAELLDMALSGKFNNIMQTIKAFGKHKSVPNWGNLEQVAKVLRNAVKDKDCVTKSKVLKSLIKGEYASLKAQYGIPEPNFGNMKGMIQNVADLVEPKYNQIPCQLQAKLLDMALSGKFDVIRQMIKDKATPGIRALSKLGLQLQKATAHMNCQEKNKVFDSVLAADWPSLKYLGIDTPQFGQAEDRLRQIAKKITHQVQGMACLEKSKLFDKLIKGHGMLARELVGHVDEFNDFLNHVKNGYKNLPCQEKTKIIDLVLDGSYQKVAQILHAQAPIKIPVQIPPSKLGFMKTVKEKIKSMTCENKVEVFERMLGGPVKQAVHKFKTKH